MKTKKQPSIFIYFLSVLPPLFFLLSLIWFDLDKKTLVILAVLNILFWFLISGVLFS